MSAILKCGQYDTVDAVSDRLHACWQAFLEHGQYNTVEASRHDKGAKGQAKEAKARIHRSIGRNRPIRYEITDKAPTDKATWDRVVALFCLGKPWQFKGYPKQLFPVCILPLTLPSIVSASMTCQMLLE